MTGAGNRRKGHQAERDLVRYARAHGCPDAVTTRNTGGAGGNQIGDVVLAPGVVVEVKNVAASAWPTWIRQAQRGANGRVWAVVRKTQRVGDPGRWETVTPFASLAAHQGMFTDAEWEWTKVVDGGEPLIRCRFSLFVEAVRLDQ